MDGLLDMLGRTGAVLVALAAVPSALAQPSDIAGDALVLTATSFGRSGVLTIPASALTRDAASNTWTWSSSGPLPLVASDGSSLGAFQGMIAFDPIFDNIILDLDLTAGPRATRFALRTGDLLNSFSSPGASLMAAAHLYDRTGDGASLGGMFGTRCSQVLWDGVGRTNALPGFTAPPGGDSVSSEPRVVVAPYAGRESLAVDMTLSAGDAVSMRVASIVAVPAPHSGAALLLAVAIPATRRRRRTHG